MKKYLLLALSVFLSTQVEAALFAHAPHLGIVLQEGKAMILITENGNKIRVEKKDILTKAPYKKGQEVTFVDRTEDLVHVKVVADAEPKEADSADPSKAPENTKPTPSPVKSH